MSATTCTIRPFAFASPAEAVAALAARLSPVGLETGALSQSVGRVLGEPVRADRPSPACDVSAMDGYAVRLRDLPHGRLTIAGEASIGQPPATMAAAPVVMRIFTGGPVPHGAEAVIPREQVVEHCDSIEIGADVATEVRTGQHIRNTGENCPAGVCVVDAGTAVNVPIRASLASFGCTRVTLRRRVRVAAIVTGNEVHDAHAAVEPWQIRDNNGPTLAAMFGPLAWVQWLGCHHVHDDAAAIGRLVRQLLPRVDALLLTGGVSMGEYDHVPAVIADAGCKTIFHRLPIRPGKPVLGAVGPAGQAVLGLPGNPVSVMTTARRIAAATLRRLAGLTVTDEPTAVVELMEPPAKTIPLHLSLPVRLCADGEAVTVASRGSGDIVAAARSDGFVELPPNASGIGPWPFYRWSMS